MTQKAWAADLRQHLGKWWQQLRARWRPPPRAAPYPDYVPCPFCGEPEIEVWCDQLTAQCHKCGRTFAYTPPADCQPES